MQIDINELKKEGRVYVDYPESLRVGVQEAMDAWKSFCAMPVEDKKRFPYDPDTNVSGNGYEYNAGVDQKELMHLRVVAEDRLMECAHRVDNTIAPDFVKKALALNPLMAPVLSAFGESVGLEMGLPGFQGAVMVKQPRWLIRFLHYFGDRKPDEVIAAPHNDKGGFTLHLYESDPGVEMLTYDTREWVSMPLSHDQTVIIAGNGLQNFTQNRIRALSHRVVATEETAERGRFSAVCFFNFEGMRVFDKTLFGPQQSRPAGWAYDMPFDEFDSYFKDDLPKAA